MSNKNYRQVLIQDQQYLALVIGVNPFNSAQLTEEFLKQERIIPRHWRQKKTSFSNFKGVELHFQEGIIFRGELNQLTIQETLEPQNLDKMVFATLAYNLIDQLSQKKYTQIKIKFERSFAIPKLDHFAINYLKNNLLSPKVNPGLKNHLISGEINYCYQLDHCQLKLKVTASQKQANLSPLLRFTGSFNYKIDVLSVTSPDEQIKQIICNWQFDYQKYTNLVNFHFLG
ncbi:hypothetical protein PCC7424_1106 [Gloeothece citriformis PCC 7424]|uniref:Uncharacterized protein n=1 Tax=Gloeothece citriformis (strain PCC 7424) TaxID=65393 RepID=B7KJV8_GLOC7|nr:hypothetical protein [Gloeothece citriformis]ACK69557.1 hypothetical protein PCC7424_1106 [Gloeothece citriformis PCC 7424]